VESYLEAAIGNLTYTDMRQIYADLQGASLPIAPESNDLTFENLYLKLSSKGIMFSGKVTFNGCSSAEGKVEISERGLEINGAIGNFKIPNTEIVIKSASLDLFIGASTKDGDETTKRINRFAIQGDVEFEGNKVVARFFTTNAGKSKGQKWMLYGAFDGDLRLSHLSKDFSDPKQDIALRQAAIIASNIEEADKDGAGLSKELNALGFPVSKGMLNMYLGGTRMLKST
jgi:hypothetical protein